MARLRNVIEVNGVPAALLGGAATDHAIRITAKTNGGTAAGAANTDHTDDQTDKENLNIQPAQNPG